MEFKVMKTEFYFNNPEDYGFSEEDVVTFKTLTEAQRFCENNLYKLCDKPEQALEIQQGNVVLVQYKYETA